MALPIRSLDWFGGHEVAKQEWGVKRTCLACAARFYDFRRSPIICPSCGAEFMPDAALKPRRARGVPEPSKSRAAIVPPKPDKVAAAAAVVDPEVDEATAQTTPDETEAVAEELAEIEKDADGDSDSDDDGDDDDSVIEDTSDLAGADDDDIGEVREHVKGGDEV